MLARMIATLDFTPGERSLRVPESVLDSASTTESRRHREDQSLRKTVAFRFLQVQGFIRDSVTPW